VGKTLPYDILQSYKRYASLFGIRLDFLWAQALLETDGFRFTGQVPADFHNLCGLKNKNGTGFAQFSTWDAGAMAHIAHVSAYVYPDHYNSFCNWVNDPRHPTYHWNTVKVVGDFGGVDQWGGVKWCDNPEYATNIIKRWRNGY